MRCLFALQLLLGHLLGCFLHGLPDRWHTSSQLAFILVHPIVQQRPCLVALLWICCGIVIDGEAMALDTYGSQLQYDLPSFVQHLLPGICWMWAILRVLTIGGQLNAHVLVGCVCLMKHNITRMYGNIRYQTSRHVTSTTRLETKLADNKHYTQLILLRHDEEPSSTL